MCLIHYLSKLDTYIWVCDHLWLQDQEDMCLEIGLRAQPMITIVGPRVNIMGEGGPIWPYNEHEKSYYDNHEQDIHMSSKN